MTTENDAPHGGDRLVTSKENASGDPNRWLSLTRLLTWLQTNITERWQNHGKHSSACRHPITEVNNAAYDALSNPSDNTIYWWEE